MADELLTSLSEGQLVTLTCVQRSCTLGRGGTLGSGQASHGTKWL